MSTTFNVGSVALAGALAASGLAACGGSSSNSTAPSANSTGSCPSGSLSGAGSTFQQNVEQQWSSQFGNACSGAKVNYQGIGSGAGIQQFGAGTIDFAGSDVTMKPDEQAAANKRCGGTAIHIPIVAGGIAIEYNLSGVKSLNLSAKTIADIFQGNVKKWNASEIAADNPGTSLPSTTVTPYHRSDGSGTTSVLSSFLAATAPNWKLGTGKTLTWPSRAGQGAKGSDGVTQGVKQTDGGIGYSEVSFAQASGLSTAKVKGATGDFTDLTTANVSQALSSGFTVSGTGNDVKGTIDFAKIQGYPISTVTYVIACQHYSDSAKAKLLDAYLVYGLTAGQQGLEQLGFAPLPSDLAAKAKAAAQSIS